MAPSKHNVLVLLGVVASLQAAPAPMPKPDVPAPRQITLNLPSYSISWDPPLPTQSTPDSTESENPGYTPTPIPQPSDQISLSPPSYSISWDGPQVPSSATTPEEPAEPTPQPPTPSNQINLTPPSYSISWDGSVVPTPSTTTKPGWPHWTPKPKTLTQARISASVSWNKRQDDGTEPTDTPDPEDPEDPQDPGDGGPIVIPPSFPTPGNSIGIQPPQVSISWGKRDVAEAEATPPPSIGLGNPTYSFWWPKPPKHTSGYISWGKRQAEAEPTDSFPEPTAVLPPIFPQPSDQISYNTPSASISWGKRDGADAEYPPPTWWLGNPTASLWWPQPPKHTSGYISWGKRQDDGPTEITAPIPTPTDQISVNPPSATVSWGKRQDDGPTEVTPPVQTPPNQISINPPTASISWGKRDGADYPPPTWWLGQPSGWISWDKRDGAAAEATAAPSIGLGGPNYSIWWPKPAKSSAYISWGKREAEAQADTVGLVWPTNIPKPTWDVPLPPLFTPPTYVSWGKREDEHKPKPTGPAEVPTTLITLTSPPTRPTASACSTVTKTMALPCIPPVCPDSLIACKSVEAIDSTVELEQRDEAKVREIEKTIVTIKTVKPSYAPTATVIDKCMPVPTVTEYAACPTYTCVPECPEALRM